MKIRILVLYFLFKISISFTQNNCEHYDIYYGLVETKPEQKRIVAFKSDYKEIEELVMVHPDYQCVTDSFPRGHVPAQYVKVKRKVIAYPQDPREEVIPGEYKTVIVDFNSDKKNSFYSIKDKKIRFKNKDKNGFIDCFNFNNELVKSLPISTSKTFDLTPFLFTDLHSVLIKIRLN